MKMIIWNWSATKLTLDFFLDLLSNKLLCQANFQVQAKSELPLFRLTNET